jgi:hypothetical protein
VVIDKGEDPVFFLVYPPGMSIEVYRELPKWEERLKHFHWNPRRYDLGDAVQGYIIGHQDYEMIVDHLEENPEELESVNSSIADLLMEDSERTIVEEWVAEEIRLANERENGLLIVTGVEMLHPFLQIGRIEQRLQGRISCPVVVLYPGTRTGSFGLKYLGFYDADGNYRSRHIGGTQL